MYWKMGPIQSCGMPSAPRKRRKRPPGSSVGPSRKSTRRSVDSKAETTTCPHCGHALATFCPACRGRVGGREMSDAQKAARRENARTARHVRKLKAMAKLRQEEGRKAALAWQGPLREPLHCTFAHCAEPARKRRRDGVPRCEYHERIARGD